MDSRIPSYLNEQLMRYDRDTVEAILQGFMSQKPVTLRANRLKAGIDKVKAALNASCITFETVPWYEDALILPDAQQDQIEALPLYTEGEIYLQSLSAMIPALWLPLRRGMSVLDMCAAPGGKTTQIASLAQGAVSITACERDKVRAERLRFNLQRQGVRQATVMQIDARQLDDLFRFDAILLDAPCTGSGTLLIAPEEPVRRMDPAWVRKTVQTQQALMRKALRLLVKGGTLVYATCSILPEENDGVVQTALENGAELVPMNASWLDALPRLPSMDGTLCIQPTALYEGFYTAVLRKK